MKKKNLIKTLCFAFAASLYFSCYASDAHEPEKNNVQGGYCSDEELSRRSSAYPLLDDALSWKFQYPSGTAEGGMLQAEVTKDFKSKYFSLYTAENGCQYMRFSLNANDKGKSKNGSSVRAELRNLKEWNFSSRAELSYSFYLTSTDFSRAKFTVGQFLQHCEKKDSPLCRIEIENGEINAKVINYKTDGITKSDGKTHIYNLGTIGQNQETSIRISVDGKKMKLFRDNKLKAEHNFSDEVSAVRQNYFKAGIYYQNRDSPDIFTEVFMSRLKAGITDGGKNSEL